MGDALFSEWPQVDAIIGNPPFQSKNKSQGELGAGYLSRVRKRYPGVPGHADHCVYWFRRAHDELPAGGRAGLVGTNTIRQNQSRVGGLDYIVAHGGTITEAVSTQPWPGEAVLHVSIVNWIKGEAPGVKTLWEQRGDRADAPWERFELPVISSSLSPRVDLATAKDLAVNLGPKTTFQGQTPGVLSRELPSSPAAVADGWIAEDASSEEVLFRYLVGDDLLDNAGEAPPTAGCSTSARGTWPRRAVTGARSPTSRGSSSRDAGRRPRRSGLATPTSPAPRPRG